MAGGFGGLGSYANGASFGVGANGTPSFQLTVSATANAKGPWTLIATLTGDCVAIVPQLLYFNQGATNTDFGASIDIGIGANNANVQTLISNINLTNQVSGDWDCFVTTTFPVSLPAGTQIWARYAITVASSTSLVYASLLALDNDFVGNFELAGVDTLGWTATGQGTRLIGASAAKGAWATIVAATVRDYAGFITIMDLGNQTAGGGAIRAVFDIAIGDPKNIVLPDIITTMNDQSFAAPFVEFLDIQIPAGSAIFGRSANIDATTNQMGVTLYALYQ